VGSGVCAERRHKHGRPLWGATLAPPIDRRTGEASVIVAADGLTASDAVGCQLNLEHIHDRQPSTRASLRGLSRANSDTANRSAPYRHGEPVSATDGQVPAADPRASRQPVFDFHARSTSSWAPLAAEPTRACYTDRTVMRAFPLSARNQRGFQVGLAPTERRSALLGGALHVGAPYCSCPLMVPKQNLRMAGHQ
jgi:hypothetical protein